QTFTEDVSVNVRYLSEGLRLLEVPHDAFAVRAPDGTYYGANGQAVERFCRSADLFLNVSGCCWLRDEYRGARRTAYLDSDPGYTQSKLLAYESGHATKDELFSVNLIHEHDCFFTFAENFGAADCLIPACGIGWQVANAGEKSATMSSYRSYLQEARGEWSVAKNVYVALRSGWFSCRSAAYLALGKPVVVEDTGWSKYYPTGHGLFAFETPEQA